MDRRKEKGLELYVERPRLRAAGIKGTLSVESAQWLPLSTLSTADRIDTAWLARFV
jgi:hypothetical protein